MWILGPWLPSAWHLFPSAWHLFPLFPSAWHLFGCARHRYARLRCAWHLFAWLLFALSSGSAAGVELTETVSAVDSTRPVESNRPIDGPGNECVSHDRVEHSDSGLWMPPPLANSESQPPCRAESLPADWRWQILPQSLVYPQYLASTKESRFAIHIYDLQNDGWLYDGILGTRVGLLRFGDCHPTLPQGFQIDAEGSAQVRLDFSEDLDVRSVDFRAGLPVTYGVGSHRWKLGYYHLSSHLGDEFLLKNPTFERLNYSRDVLVMGHVYFWTDELRSYFEAGWAFKSDISEPWEFQFGVDLAPVHPTGLRGAPFWAINAHLREELDFGGGYSFQAGWAWRGGTSSNMLRIGLQYYQGKSNQLSFFDRQEEQIGIGVWYDP